MYKVEMFQGLDEASIVFTEVDDVSYDLGVYFIKKGNVESVYNITHFTNIIVTKIGE